MNQSKEGQEAEELEPAGLKGKPECNPWVGWRRGSQGHGQVAQGLGKALGMLI